MKTLKAFWHWVDNEKPPAIPYKALETLTNAEDRAVTLACELLGERLGYDDAGWPGLDELRDHWPAVSDLSLVICSGIEVMHEDVPEPAEPVADAFLRERYAEPVKLPAVVEHGSKAFGPERCAACGSAPCSGTHVNCDLKTYLAAHPEAQAAFKAPEPIYRREYMGEWVTSLDLSADAIERSKRLTEQQLAAMNQQPFRNVGADGPKLANNPGAIRSLADWLPPLPPPRANDAPLSGQRVSRQELDAIEPSTRLQNLGQKLARLNEQRVRGRVGTHWDPRTRELHIYTSVTAEELDRVRGLNPRMVTIHGRDSDYARHILPYLRDVLSPMVHGGPLFHAPEGATLPSGW